MMKDVYSVPEIAEICKVTRFTVNSWIKKGILPAFRPMDRGMWKIKSDDLIAFLRKQGYPLEFLNGNKIKILIIDDEEMVIKIIRRTFQDMDNYLLDTANTGFTAGAKLESFRPDIVILDICLGDMDGREFFNHIRNHPEFQYVKVIGISGKLDKAEINDLIARGFDDFIMKPFKSGALRNAVKQAVSQGVNYSIKRGITHE
ncbi:response regulator [candidate division KSB1 bacterium]